MGGSGNPPKNNTPQYNFNQGNMAGAEGTAFSGINGIGGWNVPLRQNQGGMQGIASGAMAGTNYDASGISNLGSNLVSSANYAVPASIAQGFDPQGALYRNAQFQNSDQMNAILAQNGLAGTPLGAYDAAKANSDFNLGWRGNELAWQGQGLQNAGMAAGLGQLGANLSQSVPQFGMNMGLAADQGALMQAQLPQQQIQDYLSFLSTGLGAEQASNQVYGTNLGAWQTQQQNNASGLGGIGSAIGTGLSFLPKLASFLPAAVAV